MFVALKPKLCCYLTDDECVDKKANKRKKCFVKRKIKFEDYKNHEEANRHVIKMKKNHIAASKLLISFEKSHIASKDLKKNYK